MKPAYLNLLKWIVSLLVPLVLFLGAVRLVLTPLYLEVEYRTPGFPDDPAYSFYMPPQLEPFSFDERMQHARTAVQYLLNDADISFLGDLRFREGQQAPPLSCQYMDDCTRLYNDRELSHMVDVKVVTQAALRVWYFSVALILALGVWAFAGGWMRAYRAALSVGGWLTVGLVAIILLLVVAAFGAFFVFFHEIFFAAGTWSFLGSDTLIRLFPERFWRDTFLAVGLLSFVFGLAVALLARPK